MDKKPCKMVSFNCKSFKRSLEGVRDICLFADVVALQETWLLPYDLPMLSTVSSNFEYVGKSAVDPSEGILRGRPYGGVAILWRRGIFKTVAVVGCDNARICAIKAILENEQSIIIFSIYMPTDACENVVEFTNCLSEIQAIIENNDVESVFMLGDFNSHPEQPFWMELCGFCTDQSWTCVDMELLGLNSNTFTYRSDINGSLRWLDHCIVTQAARRTVTDVSIGHDIYWSDHLPLIIECDLKLVVPKAYKNDSYCNKILWGHRTGEQIRRYHDSCNSDLEAICFPELFVSCEGKMCTDPRHRIGLDSMYQDIVRVLSRAASMTYRGDIVLRKGRVAGWNKHVRNAHCEARLKYQTWLLYNKPKAGRIWDELCESQKIFKSRLRWCQNHQDEIKMDMIASHRREKKFSKFWKATNNLNVRPSLPVSVAGCTTHKEIADLFKDHFRVSSPLGPSEGVVDADVSCDKELLRFSAKQVSAVINKMTRGKSPGHDSLSIEHLRGAGVHLPRVLAMFYSLCISHAYIPVDMMKTIVVPIVKNKTGDIADRSNYRPISLATIIAKVLDSLFDKQLSETLNFHDAQFGFRPGLSTETAILSLKQTVQYYTSRKTPVYACFLDLSKAFDLVSYDVLWKKMERAGVRPELLSIMRFWYASQINNVRWGKELSDPYRLECGVRQGGLTSPKLFNLYMNDLIEELSKMPVGCWIDGVCVNNISYADDMVLLAPTAGSIRELLKICEKYAARHGLVYNVTKSEYLIFKAPRKQVQYEPSISLNGRLLKRVTKFKYLGHYVTEDLKDQVDIERERRALSVRCNMLARRFARCSKEAKITLFKAYCQTFYTGSLWVNYTQKAIGALRVQYNNGFRMLLGLPWSCSASGMFAQERTDDFHAMMRKKASSLLARLRSSSNGILKMLVSKTESPILQHWISVLVLGR